MQTIPDSIRRELSVAEQVHWFGQPRQGIVFRGTDAFVIPFSVLWCGFVIVWETMAIRAPNAPAIFALWGIPFVLVGIYFVVGRFFADAMLRTRIFYAVTNERVLIVSGLYNRKVKSLNLRTLADLSLSERNDGEGSISFGGGSQSGTAFGGLAGWLGPGSQVAPCFEFVANARSVFEIIRGAQRRSTQESI